MSRNIRNFLLHIRKTLADGSYGSPLRFVSGNQSCDMDSAVCALTYSYFSYLQNPANLVIPMFNIPREELRLRKDISLLLSSYEITSDLLFFVDDLAAIIDNNAQKINLVLVDHCNIQGDEWHHYLAQGRLEVTGIIDHHDDEGFAVAADPRIITTTGSCSSLVSAYWFAKLDVTSVFSSQTEAVELLMAPLLLDTSNMSRKVEDPDRVAFEAYSDILLSSVGILTIAEFAGVESNNDNSSGSSFDKTLAKSYIKTLKSLKKNLDGFTFYDILRKDYKSFTFATTTQNSIRVGFSSLTADFEYCCTVHVDDFVSGSSLLLKNNNLDLLVMTASFTDKETNIYSRQFGLFYRHDSQYTQLFESLPKLVHDALDLNQKIPHIEEYKDFIDSLNNSTDFRFVLFNQGNTAASRKQVVPAVKSAIEQ